MSQDVVCKPLLTKKYYFLLIGLHIQYCYFLSVVLNYSHSFEQGGAHGRNRKKSQRKGRGFLPGKG